MIEDRWAEEEAWWTMGAAEARRRTHPAALMVFDSGILQGEAIFEALDGAPRWDSVQMTGRTVSESGDCTVLAYRATARREDGKLHEALCSSTWVRQGAGWLLIQHQQTAPADG